MNRGSRHQRRLKNDPLLAAPEPRSARVRIVLVSAVVMGVGLLVAWIALSYAGWLQRQHWPAAAMPFVLNRVLVIHLLCVAPITVWLAWQLVRGLPAQPLLLLSLGSLAGLMVALLAMSGASGVAQLVAGVDSTGCHLIRLASSAALLLPWSVAAAGWARGSGFRLTGMWVDALIVSLLLLLPVIHVQELTRRESQVVSDFVVNGQFADALRRCQVLVRMGRQQIGQQPADQLLAGLQQRVGAYQQQLQRPLPESASADAEIRRARLLFGVGQYDDAQNLLRRWSASRPEAAWRLALTHEVQGDFAKAAAGYQDVIEMIRPVQQPTEPQLKWLRSAFERRSNNLRRINEAPRAEQELLAGLEDFPVIKPSLLMQLGFHYQMAGRLSEAMDYFERAAAIDPQYQSQVAIQRQRLNAEAQGCVIRSTRGVTR